MQWEANSGDGLMSVLDVGMIVSKPAGRLVKGDKITARWYGMKGVFKAKVITAEQYESVPWYLEPACKLVEKLQDVPDVIRELPSLIRDLPDRLVAAFHGNESNRGETWPFGVREVRILFVSRRIIE